MREQKCSKARYWKQSVAHLYSGDHTPHDVHKQISLSVSLAGRSLFDLASRVLLEQI